MDEVNVGVPRRLTAEEWRKHFDEQPKCGKTVSDYCRENGLTVHKFYYWRARLNEDEDGKGQSRFVECRLKQSVSPLVLECMGGHRLHIGLGFDEETLKRVLGVLARC